MFRLFHTHPLALVSALAITLVVLLGVSRLAGREGGLTLLHRVGVELSQQVVVVGHRVVQQVVVVGQRLKGE
ncbi:MAG: hypothetical protein HUU30_14010 [Burkholderiaceae bacterium]|nr:hypothetical protein [Aquabacterium sp.]NUP86849.1 hypothetical protein [Burkholderiaceae bacterium]